MDQTVLPRRTYCVVDGTVLHGAASCNIAVFSYLSVAALMQFMLLATQGNHCLIHVLNCVVDIYWPTVTLKHGSSTLG
jgi:hypothetical protein